MVAGPDDARHALGMVGKNAGESWGRCFPRPGNGKGIEGRGAGTFVDFESSIGDGSVGEGKRCLGQRWRLV